MGWMLRMVGMGALLSACTVEEVIVDTGGPAASDPSATERPQADPRPDPGSEDEATPAEEDPTPYVEPNELLAGEQVLAFVVSDGAADLSAAVDLQLYGEPDVTIEMWALRDADEIAVSLQVASSSPAGPLDVVVELSDGSVFRIPDGITVVR